MGENARRRFDIVFARAAGVLAAAAIATGSSSVRADETSTEVDLGHYGSWPDLALGSDGVVHMSYVRCDTPNGPAGCALRYRRFEAGAWQTEETIPGAGNPVRDAKFRGALPRVAVDATGSVHLVWKALPMTTGGPLYTRRAAGGGWSAAVTTSTDDVEFFDVETFGAEVVVAANAINPEAAYVYSRAVDGGGAFTSRRLTAGSGMLRYAGKDMSLYRGPTHLVAAYWWVDGFIGFRLYELESAWSSELAIANPPPDSWQRLSVTEQRRGTAVERSIAFTAWDRASATPKNVYVREPTGKYVMLSTSPIDPQSDPILTSDSRGNRYVVWYDATHSLRYSNYLSTRPSWLPEAVFPTLTKVEQLVMVTAERDHHLVWRDPDTGRLHHNHRVVAGALADGGDAGDAAVRPDAASSADAQSGPVVDADGAGPVPRDGGGAVADRDDGAAAPAADDAAKGCGCRVHGLSDGAWALPGALAVGLAWLRREVRRRDRAARGR